MKAYLDSFSNRTKAIYIIWVFINFVLLLLGGSLSRRYSSFDPGVFPFDLGGYDYSEFILYSIAPIVLNIIYRLWKKENNILNAESRQKEKVSKPLNKIILVLRILLILTTLLIASLYQYYSLYSIYGSVIINKDIQDFFAIPWVAENFWNAILPKIVGSVFVLVCIPAIIGLVRLIRGKTAKAGMYIIYFMIVFILSFFSFYPILLSQSLTANNSTENQSTSIENNYKFSSPEYSIIFPSKPKITELSAPLNGIIAKGKKAELVIEEEKALIRAEYIGLDFLYPLSEESRTKLWQQITANTDYNIGNLETFKQKMLNPTSRRKFYDQATDPKSYGLSGPTINLGDFNTFEAKMTGTYLVNSDYTNKMLNEYSVSQGLKYPTFNYTENYLGKIASVRGYKTLVNDNGNEIKMTFEAIHYYGKSYCMILYFGCPSENYPTPSITKFKDSLKRL